MDFLAPLVLFAPLAGLAALYTAAAVNSNSALVTIGVLNTGRKRRALDTPLGMKMPQMEFLNHNHVNVTDMSYQLMAKHLEKSNDNCLQQVIMSLNH